VQASATPDERSSRTIAALGDVLLRLSVGGMLIPHGLGRLFGAGGQGLARNGAWLEANGVPAGELVALSLGALELVGGVLIVVGLLTRPMAFAVAGAIAISVLLHWPNGYFWLTGGPPSNAGRWSIVWGAAVLAIALRGAGGYSLDEFRRRSLHRRSSR
jgi:putative oxidoreductase